MPFETVSERRGERISQIAITAKTPKKKLNRTGTSLRIIQSIQLIFVFPPIFAYY
jgi:hypothetical protein